MKSFDVEDAKVLLDALRRAYPDQRCYRDGDPAGWVRHFVDTLHDLPGSAVLRAAETWLKSATRPPRTPELHAAAAELAAEDDRRRDRKRQVCLLVLRRMLDHGRKAADDALIEWADTALDRLQSLDAGSDVEPEVARQIEQWRRYFVGQDADGAASRVPQPEPKQAELFADGSARRAS